MMGVQKFVRKELVMYFNWAMHKPKVRRLALASTFAVYSGDKKMKYKALLGFACFTPIPGVFFGGIAAIGYFAVKDIYNHLSGFKDNKRQHQINLNRDFEKSLANPHTENITASNFLQSSHDPSCDLL